VSSSEGEPGGANVGSAQRDSSAASHPGIERSPAGGTIAAAERIPLAEPALGGNARAYLDECLDTNFVSSVGPFVGRFERAFAEAVGSRHAVACASGTAAIHLALRVLDIGPRDEVVVPTLTFVASANPVRYLGATPLLVDAEPRTFNLDPALVVDELDRRARDGRRQPAAIEVVHLLGHPADIEPVLDAARRHDVPVVEDAAEALGARYVGGPLDGRHVGTLGRVGCFSFNGNKLVTTGAGGMLVTDDDDLAARARHLSTQARLPGLAYDHDDVGYNYRLSNIAAAIGLAQVELLAELLAGRRANAAAYDAAIRDLPALRPAPRAAWADPSFWLYTASLAERSPVTRDELIAALATAGIESRPMWTPLHRTRVWRDAPRLGGAIAESLFDVGFSLPSSSNLDDARRGRVVAGLRSALGARA
jgi:dTDP-4-amino-4,6-dideoxygalactose transaminase